MDVTRLRTSEVDLLFRDWSVTVVLREVQDQQVLDSGELSGTVVDVEVPAVVWSVEPEVTRRTGHQHVVREQMFLVRMADLPEGLKLASAQVVQGGTAWVISQVLRLDGEGLVRLRGQRT